MKTLFVIGFIASIILFFYIVVKKGKSYGRYLIEHKLATEEEIMNAGYLGVFFAWLFGGDWLN